jgi:HNH endonuclease
VEQDNDRAPLGNQPADLRARPATSRPQPLPLVAMVRIAYRGLCCWGVNQYVVAQPMTKKTSTSLTSEELKKWVLYDPKTGRFTRLKDTARCREGSLTGGLSSDGHWRTRINWIRYLEHRLAWLYVHGEWPKTDLDHINRNKLDNRIENLREATKTQNGANMKISKHNTSGHKGVYRCRSKTSPWCARISHDYIGVFKTKEEAAVAYLAEAKTRYGEFATDGAGAPQTTRDWRR